MTEGGFSIPSNSFRMQYCKYCALTSESIMTWALLVIQNELQVYVYRSKKISAVVMLQDNSWIL